MTFDQVQNYFSSLITADSQLGSMGTPILVDPFLDPEAAKSQIASALRAHGVCFEIGFPTVGAPETLLDGTTKINAIVEIFAAEHSTVAHTPSRALFVERVITACTKRPSTNQKPAILRTSESVKTEQGYILHMFTFELPMNIKQPSS